MYQNEEKCLLLAGLPPSWPLYNGRRGGGPIRGQGGAPVDQTVGRNEIARICISDWGLVGKTYTGHKNQHRLFLSGKHQTCRLVFGPSITVHIYTSVQYAKRVQDWTSKLDSFKMSTDIKMYISSRRSWNKELGGMLPRYPGISVVRQIIRIFVPLICTASPCSSSVRTSRIECPTFYL